jgi:hypothetical protein
VDRLGVLGQRGHLGDGLGEPGVPCGGQGAGVGLAGGECLAQFGVHHGDRLAQPGRLGREVAADLVGP